MLIYKLCRILKFAVIDHYENSHYVNDPRWIALVLSSIKCSCKFIHKVDIKCYPISWKAIDPLDDYLGEFYFIVKFYVNDARYVMETLAEEDFGIDYHIENCVEYCERSGHKVKYEIIAE